MYAQRKYKEGNNKEKGKKLMENNRSDQQNQK